MCWIIKGNARYNIDPPREFVGCCSLRLIMVRDRQHNSRGRQWHLGLCDQREEMWSKIVNRLYSPQKSECPNRTIVWKDLSITKRPLYLFPKSNDSQGSLDRVAL